MEDGPSRPEGSIDRSELFGQKGVLMGDLFHAPILCLPTDLYNRGLGTDSDRHRFHTKEPRRELQA